MNQKHMMILVVVLFAAAAFVGGYLWRGSNDDEQEPAASVSVSVSVSPSATPVPKTPVPTVAYTPRLYTVSLTESGPSPKSLTIRAGDAVRFLNLASFAVWPASDPHPSHTMCPGFDAGRGLNAGEDYTLVFPTATTCTYHSHLDPSNEVLRGTIIVQ
jgi:hypothetical protein